MNPTMTKHTSTADMLIQVLLACASGDLQYIKR
jgi:hypothetical protein